MKENKQAFRHLQDRGKQINSDHGVFVRLIENVLHFLVQLLWVSCCVSVNVDEVTLQMSARTNPRLDYVTRPSLLSVPTEIRFCPKTYQYQTS